eukprot:Filipodium_phascolosomae@DN1268_c0_g1_i1.p1
MPPIPPATPTALGEAAARPGGPLYWAFRNAYFYNSRYIFAPYKLKNGWKYSLGHTAAFGTFKRSYDPLVSAMDFFHARENHLTGLGIRVHQWLAQFIFFVTVVPMMIVHQHYRFEQAGRYSAFKKWRDIRASTGEAA